MHCLVTSVLGTSNSLFIGFVYSQRFLLFKNEFPAFGLGAGERSLEGAEGKAEGV